MVGLEATKRSDRQSIRSQPDSSKPQSWDFKFHATTTPGGFPEEHSRRTVPK